MTNYVTKQFRIPDTDKEAARLLRALADVQGQLSRIERICSDSMWGVVWIPEDMLEQWAEKMKRPAKPRSQTPQKRRPSCANFKAEARED